MKAIKSRSALLFHVSYRLTETVRCLIGSLCISVIPTVSLVLSLTLGSPRTQCGCQLLVLPSWYSYKDLPCGFISLGLGGCFESWGLEIGHWLPQIMMFRVWGLKIAWKYEKNTGFSRWQERVLESSETSKFWASSGTGNRSYYLLFTFMAYQL